jgi:hypothetical protein
VDQEDGIKLLKNPEWMWKAKMNKEVKIGRLVPDPEAYLVDDSKSEIIALTARGTNHSDILIEIGKCDILTEPIFSDFYISQEFVFTMGKREIQYSKRRTHWAEKADRILTNTMYGASTGELLYDRGELADKIESVLSEVANNSRVNSRISLPKIVMDPRENI